MYQYHKTIQCELTELINDVREYNLGALKLPGNIPAHVNPWIRPKNNSNITHGREEGENA